MSQMKPEGNRVIWMEHKTWEDELNQAEGSPLLPPEYNILRKYVHLFVSCIHSLLQLELHK